MARTLFRPRREAVPEDGFEDSVRSDSGSLRIPTLEFLRIDGTLIVTEPTSRAWLALDPDEARSIPDSSAGSGSLPQHIRQYFAGTRAAVREDAACQPQREAGELYFFEFVVTQGCNLGCVYCFAGAGPSANGPHATESTAELLIDRIAEYRAQTRTGAKFVVEFTGGEPLLNFRAIRRTVEYAERTYGDLLGVEFCIQSNLTRLAGSTLQFLLDHGVRIGVSCDGYARIHDAQRPHVSGRGTHATVERRMQDLRVRAPAATGGVIAVITPTGAREIPELMLYFAMCGYDELVFRPEERLGRSGQAERTSPGRDYVDGLFQALCSVVAPYYRLTGRLLREQYTTLTFEHLLGPERPFMCERSPCGAARNICAVDGDGNVYACHQATGNASFRLGSLRDRSFQDLTRTPLAQALSLRIPSAIPLCRTCLYRGWCDAPCPVTALARHGSMLSPSGDCSLHRYRYERAIRGLLRNEFDLDVIGHLVDPPRAPAWLEVRGQDGHASANLETEGGEFHGRN